MWTGPSVGYMNTARTCHSLDLCLLFMQHGIGKNVCLSLNVTSRRRGRFS